MVNSYFFKKEKVIELLNKIQNELELKSRSLNKAFESDYKKWEVKIEVEQLLKIIQNITKQEYLPKFTKQEIIDGIGKIALINTYNPYMILNFILLSIYTNNKVCVVLENKFLASNIAIIEVIKKVLKDMNYEQIIDYKEVLKKEEIIQVQEEFDMIYYIGNKEEYLNFIKRIHIDSKFENFGEIYVYVDNKEFKDRLLNIDKLAYNNELQVNYYNNNFEFAINSINKYNNINKVSIIFTKNTEKAYEFIKKIKSEKIYINEEPEISSIYNINPNNLIIKKEIVLKK